MAQSLRQVKNRIRSIENTRKVTNAMQMISVAKLNRMDDQLFAVRAYCERLEGFLRNITSVPEMMTHPFFSTPKAKGEIVLCVITSDNGLCGVYNNNVLHAAEKFIALQGKERTKLVTVGRRGFQYLKTKGFESLSTYQGSNGVYSEPVMRQIAKELTDLFLDAKIEKIYVAYTRFENALILKPVVEQFLPLERHSKNNVEYIFETEARSLVEQLLPKYLFGKMRLVLYEAFTSEHAARTVAMKSASENAKDLLERLILMRNKVRQANITQDIMGIISSAEALKG